MLDIPRTSVAPDGTFAGAVFRRLHEALKKAIAPPLCSRSRERLAAIVQDAEAYKRLPRHRRSRVFGIRNRRVLDDVAHGAPCPPSRVWTTSVQHGLSH